ncbi:MAG: hypothetical protein B7X10_03770 [Burkholderiales bacterium 21-58-4]|nr:MAG: hypothetical protein B7X10_03770 [Burkholderiales bacterium 21-58-4]
MALKTKTVTITSEGRDLGKNFKLTEMPVAKGEKWAARALLALAKAGVEVPEDADGMAGLAGFGLSSIDKLDWNDIEPLLDEMLGCIKYVPSAGVERALMLEAGDIEEITTLFTLRKEILALHFDFFAPAVGSTSDTKVPPASN